MKPAFTLELRPLDRADAMKARAWRNDHRIWQWCRQSDVISDVEQEAWFERQAKDPTIKMYAVTTGLDGSRQMIGVAGLTSIDHLNRRAEFSLYVAPEYQGRGYGKEALKVLLLHGFANLGLGVIWGETFDGNPAVKTFEALGMVKEGTRRQFYFRNGRMIDAHLYSITRQEWQSSLSRPSSPDSSSRASSTSPSDSSSTSSSSAQDQADRHTREAEAIDRLLSPSRPSAREPGLASVVPSSTTTNQSGKGSKTKGRKPDKVKSEAVPC